MNELAFLIQSKQTVDDYGDPVLTEVERAVYCREESIGQKEFYQAHALGFQPELKLVLADYMIYHGEQSLLYTPKWEVGQSEYGILEFRYERQRYRILRTYRTGQELELVCYREVNPA